MEGDRPHPSSDSPYAAFISHSSADAARAKKVQELLELRGLRCWIAPRDVRPGREYLSEIARGIDLSKSLVLLLSKESNTSRYVRREIERAAGKDKPILPIRLEDVEPSRDIEIIIAPLQRIDLFAIGAERTADVLAESIKHAGTDDHDHLLPQHSLGGGQPRKRKIQIVAAACLGFLLVGVTIAILALTQPSPPPIEPPTDGDKLSTTHPFTPPKPVDPSDRPSGVVSDDGALEPLAEGSDSVSENTDNAERGPVASIELINPPDVYEHGNGDPIPVRVTRVDDDPSLELRVEFRRAGLATLPIVHASFSRPWSVQAEWLDALEPGEYRVQALLVRDGSEVAVAQHHTIEIREREISISDAQELYQAALEAGDVERAGDLLLQVLELQGGVATGGWRLMANEYVSMIRGLFPGLTRFDRVPLSATVIAVLEQVAQEGVPRAAMLVINALLEYREDLEHMNCAQDRIPLIDSMFEIAVRGNVEFVHGYLGDYERYVRGRGSAAYNNYMLGHEKGDPHCTARIAFILMVGPDANAEETAQQVFAELWPRRAETGPEFARLAAEKDSPHGLYYYGVHLWGESLTVDEELQAVDFLVRAVEGGHPAARRFLIEEVETFDSSLITPDRKSVV